MESERAMEKIPYAEARVDRIRVNLRWPQYVSLGCFVASMLIQMEQIGIRRVWMGSINWWLTPSLFQTLANVLYVGCWAALLCNRNIVGCLYLAIGSTVTAVIAVATAPYAWFLLQGPLLTAPLVLWLAAPVVLAVSLYHAIARRSESASAAIDLGRTVLPLVSVLSFVLSMCMDGWKVALLAVLGTWIGLTDNSSHNLLLPCLLGTISNVAYLIALISFRKARRFSALLALIALTTAITCVIPLPTQSKSLNLGYLMWSAAPAALLAAALFPRRRPPQTGGFPILTSTVTA